MIFIIYSGNGILFSIGSKWRECGMVGSAMTAKLPQVRKCGRAIRADYSLASNLTFHLLGIGGCSTIYGRGKVLAG